MKNTLNKTIQLFALTLLFSSFLPLYAMEESSNDNNAISKYNNPKTNRNKNSAATPNSLFDICANAIAITFINNPYYITDAIIKSDQSFQKFFLDYCITNPLSPFHEKSYVQKQEQYTGNYVKHYEYELEEIHKDCLIRLLENIAEKNNPLNLDSNTLQRYINLLRYYPQQLLENIKNKKTQLAINLIEQGTNPTQALCHFIRNNDSANFQWLLKQCNKKNDKNWINDKNSEPFIIAIENANNNEYINCLFQYHKFNLNQDIFNITIKKIIQNDDKKSYKMLIEKGLEPNLNIVTKFLKNKKKTPSLKIVKHLIKTYPTQINSYDHNGNTPLHNICQNPELFHTKHAIDLLLKNGAEPNAKNNAGHTPLDLLFIVRNHKYDGTVSLTTRDFLLYDIRDLIANQNMKCDEKNINIKKLAKLTCGFKTYFQVKKTNTIYAFDKIYELEDNLTNKIIAYFKTMAKNIIEINFKLWQSINQNNPEIDLSQIEQAILDISKDIQPEKPTLFNDKREEYKSKYLTVPLDLKDFKVISSITEDQEYITNMINAINDCLPIYPSSYGNHLCACVHIRQLQEKSCDYSCIKFYIENIEKIVIDHMQLNESKIEEESNTKNLKENIPTEIIHKNLDENNQNKNSANSFWTNLSSKIKNGLIFLVNNGL